MSVVGVHRYRDDVAAAGAAHAVDRPELLTRDLRAYLGQGMFSKRLTEPSLQPHDMPSLDAILLSHLHGDHFGRVARNDLDRRIPCLPRRMRPVDCADGSSGEGRHGHVGIEDVDARRAPVDDRVDPWRARSLAGRFLLPPVMGSALELSDAARRRRFYVTGDTLCRPWLRQVHERHRRADHPPRRYARTRRAGHDGR
jgi:hypothetical protein